MDFKEFGKAIADVGLPLLGTALGGPAGAAASIAAVIASKIGTPLGDLEAVMERVQADPETIAKLEEIEMKHEERLQEITLEIARLETESEIATIREVNASMRAEAASEHWPQWGWRPFWGFASGAAFLVICCFVCVLCWKAIGGDPTAMGQIPLIIGAFTTLFAIPGGILGVSAWGRNQLKLTQK